MAELGAMDTDSQPVLRCGRCNKPFDKPSTLKRHGYYCRSRGGITASRSRSCASCARRKARCDNRLPSCSACLSKGLKCQYPAPRARGTAGEAADEQGGDVPTGGAQPRPTLPSQPEAARPTSSARGATPETNTVLALSGPEEYFDWDDPTTMEFVDFRTPQPTDLISLQLLTPTLSPVTDANPTDHTVGEGTRVQPPSSPSVESRIPRQPSLFFSALIPRQRRESRLQRTAGLVLQSLKSYPLMMVHYNTPPPFIHPRLMPLVSGTVNDDDDREPLHNCISLLHMLGSRVPGSRRLFWRNVKMECQRFTEECHRWNRWGLLAAMQALALYLIVRLDEGQTEHDNVDQFLVAAAIIVGTQCEYISARTVGTNSGVANMQPSWDDWIFSESKRRICTVIQILDMLVYFEPATLCDMRQQGLLIAPLPSSRQLWEAGNDTAWRTECEREGGLTAAMAPRPTFAMAKGGELVKVERGQVRCLSGPAQLGDQPLDADRTSLSWSSASWDEWCSGMDSLGGLVMLAASLAA